MHSTPRGCVRPHATNRFSRTSTTMGAPMHSISQLTVEINGTVVSSPPFASMYWTPAQMLAHMTVNGASLRTGDLYGSGTVSGARPDQCGSLMELSWNGERPVMTGKGPRAFLEDGDVVVHARDGSVTGRPHQLGRGQRADRLARFRPPRPRVLAVVRGPAGFAELERPERVDHHRQLVEELGAE